MKRAAILGMVVALTASAWTFLAAQSGPAPKQVGLPKPEVATPAPAVAAIPTSTSPLTPLQQRFMELSAKKARLMTEEQLQQSLHNLDLEVEDLDAWSEIEVSERLLRELVVKHPTTRAAKAANSALNAIDKSRPAIAPIPTPDIKRRHFEREDLSPFGTDPSKSAPTQG